MPKYVIERVIPGAGQLSPAELQAVSKQSVAILKELGRGVTWLQSYVTDDKIYCIYESPNEELIHEHARCLGIPATVVAEIRATTSPATAAD
ncbi:MAG TPA: DUF4242 domain-containing protein [Labilithrix sp.]